MLTCKHKKYMMYTHKIPDSLSEQMFLSQHYHTNRDVRHYKWAQLRFSCELNLVNKLTILVTVDLSGDYLSSCVVSHSLLNIAETMNCFRAEIDWSFIWVTSGIELELNMFILKSVLCQFCGTGDTPHSKLKLTKIQDVHQQIQGGKLQANNYWKAIKYFAEHPWETRCWRGCYWWWQLL